MTAALADVGELSDLAVRNFAVCEVRDGMRLIGAAVDAPTAYLVLTGTMRMELPGREPIEAEAGSLVLLPRGLQPSIAGSGPTTRDVKASRASLVRHEGLLVFDAAEGGAGELRVIVGRVGTAERGSEGLLGAVTQPVVGDLSALKAALDAFARIIDEIDQPAFGSAAMTAALMKACLVYFARRYLPERAGSARPANAASRMTGVIGMISERPGDAYTVEDLAVMAGMSRSTFARQFADMTGASPMEFVLKARLRHASTLLRTTSMPVKQVAAAAGFVSRSHFSRAFRQAFAVDPRSFRAEQAETAVPQPD